MGKAGKRTESVLPLTHKPRGSGKTREYRSRLPQTNWHGGVNLLNCKARGIRNRDYPAFGVSPKWLEVCNRIYVKPLQQSTADCSNAFLPLCNTSRKRAFARFLFVIGQNLIAESAMLNIAPQGVKKSRRKIGKTYIGGGRVRSASTITGAHFSCVFFHIKNKENFYHEKDN